MTLEDTFWSLINNPRSFLSKNLIKPSGKRDTGEVTGYFSKAEGFNNKYRISEKPPTGTTCIAIKYFWVKMEDYLPGAKYYDDMLGVAIHNPPPGADFDAHAYVAVTGELSGCSIVYNDSKPSNPTFFHLHPQKGLSKVKDGDGVELERQLKARALGFQGRAKGARVYGREDYKVANAYFWIVYTSGKWRIFTQRVAKEVPPFQVSEKK